MKKVLVITYYWPPAGGGGVQRVAKFCKYMRAWGWEPIVLTVANGNYSVRDESLLNEVADIETVYRAPSLEPHVVYEKLCHLVKHVGRLRSRRHSETSGSGREFNRLHQVGELIRLNVFVPDSRIGWRRKARQKGLAIIAREKPSIIFSSAPPYTTHLIASDLKEKTGLPWVADFRDPWLENHAYNTVPRLPFVRHWNRSLEIKVLRQADCVCCATPGVRRLTERKVPKSWRHHFTVINNGYDHADVLKSVASSDCFTVSYFGTLYASGLSLTWVQAMRELIADDADFAAAFRFRIFGNVEADVIALLKSVLPVENLKISPYVPHGEMMARLYESQVLMLVVNDFPTNDIYAPGKLYEYLPTGNPILGIGPVNGDAAGILEETAAGTMFDYDDKTSIKRFLEASYGRWKANVLTTGPISYPAFERKHQARELSNVFSRLMA